jgi:hypothetical protein
MLKLVRQDTGRAAKLRSVQEIAESKASALRTFQVVGFGRPRPLARRIATSAIMTMLPLSAALNSNSAANCHSGFRCVALGPGVRAFAPCAQGRNVDVCPGNACPTIAASTD